MKFSTERLQIKPIDMADKEAILDLLTNEIVGTLSAPFSWIAAFARLLIPKILSSLGIVLPFCLAK